MESEATEAGSVDNYVNGRYRAPSRAGDHPRCGIVRLPPHGRKSERCHSSRKRKRCGTGLQPVFCGGSKYSPRTLARYDPDETLTVTASLRARL